MLIVPLFFIMQLLKGSRLPDFGPRLVRGLSFDATETFSKLLLFVSDTCAIQCFTALRDHTLTQFHR